MGKDLERRNELLDKRDRSEDEEKELKELMKKFPFGSREGRLEAVRIYNEGIEKLYRKFVGKK